MKMTWAEAGYPETAGSIPFLDGLLILEHKHIENWVAHPDAAYDVILGGNLDGVRRYILTTWEHET
jgi:hypothetical protein